MDNFEGTDLLEEILLRLDQEDVENLQKAYPNYSNAIKRIEKDEEYWRKKLSDYLEFEVFDRNGHSWKEIYEAVTHADINLSKVVEYNLPEIVQSLIELGIDPSQNDDDALIVAAKKGYVDIVEILLRDPDVNPNAMGGLPLIEASRNGHIETVLLITNHPKFDKKFGKAMNAAVRGHNIDVVEYLLDVSGRRLSDSQKLELLALAVRENDLGLAKKASSGLGTSSFNSNYLRRFLGIGIENNNLEMVQLLLPLVSNITEKQAERFLDIAMKNGNVEIVKLLASYETVSGFLNNERYLRAAIKNNDLELVKFLFEKTGMFLDSAISYIVESRPRILAFYRSQRVK